MNIGVILAHFQSVGKQPVEIDMLNNSLVRLGAIARAVDFNILADTPSKPVDLAGFRFCNNSITCSSVHRMGVGQLFGSSGVNSSRGGKE